MASEKVVPEADLYFPGSVEDLIENFHIDASTYVVAVTRNVEVDRKILPRLVETPAPYIGVIGSRRRWEETVKLLKKDGLGDVHLDRFRSPIGLELNAETPEEIAVSIMAEVIMVLRSGKGSL